MITIIVLLIIPLIIWAFMQPLGLRFSDIGSITTSLGQITGLLGMTLFSINLILAGRFKFLDRYFKGLDKVYINHHKLGLIAFCLLLFHPLFLVVRYITISIYQAGLFFLPFNNMPITWGIISLALMILLISLTIYSNLKYRSWKISHKFMTVVFIFGILHAIYIPSDISRNNLLRYYIFTLAIVGLIVSIHQAFLNKFLDKKYKYKIKNVNHLNEDVLEIEIEPIKEKLSFKSGQFAFFRFYSEGVSSESHPFSFSSESGGNNLKITVKNFGDFTGDLKRLRPGEIVIIDGPYGNFSYKKVDSKNQIWLAGGIGITPFLSMAKVLEPGYNIDLFYCVKDPKEAVHLLGLQEISKSNPNFKYNLWPSKEKGYINGKLISGMSNGLKGKDIFLCGPSAFMENLKDQFLEQGVNIKRIHYENFSL